MDLIIVTIDNYRIRVGQLLLRNYIQTTLYDNILKAISHVILYLRVSTRQPQNNGFPSNITPVFSNSKTVSTC